MRLLSIALVALIVNRVFAAPQVGAPIEQFNDPLIVNTPYGALKGYYQKPIVRNPFTSNDSNYTRAFRGVPYVSQPQRFQVAQPVQAWNGVRDATSSPYACPQLSPELWSEDCLYMNVYVPPSSRHSYNSTRKLPIMVFLHPGSYIQGSGIQNGLWNPDDVLLKRDVIFVTLNFRLNVFGCMLVPGGTPNLWLHDQRAAINFLKIIGPSFGGDPNEITLMGESSGATMVLAHIASPTSDANLIRRALVMSSPVALDAWTMERARDVSASIAKAANCDINDMRCLTTVSPLTLLIASASTLNFFFGTSRPFNFGLPWAPVTDGIHVLGDPLSVIMSRQHKLRIPLMMGTLRDEAHFLTSPIGYVSFFNVSDALNRYTVPKVLESAFGLQYRDKIMQQYKFVGNAEQQLDRAFEIITDALFTCSTRKLLAEYSKDVPETYFYHFEQNIELIFKSFGVECSNNRTCHAFDLPLFFQALLPLPPNDLAIGRYYQDSFVNFAATSSPSRPYNSTTSFAWEGFSEATPNVFVFGRPRNAGQMMKWSEITRGQDQMQQFCQFWDDTGYFFGDRNAIKSAEADQNVLQNAENAERVVRLIKLATMIF